MRVYFESMVDQVNRLQKEFTKENGFQPNRIELTGCEYRMLRKEIEDTYLIKRDLPVNIIDGEKTILGMLVTIKQ